MFPLVDWYTYTFKLPSSHGGVGRASSEYILDLMRTYEWYRKFEAETSPTYQIKEKGIYGVGGIVDTKSELSIFWGDINTHAIVACSGRACSVIFNGAGGYELIRETHNFATRCDLAIDFESDIDVVLWVVNKKKVAVKTCSHIVSEKGETRYIGSRKSERFLRIYRYNHPHPRAHLLRCELELKGKKAKAVCARFKDMTAYEVICAEFEPFLSENPLFQPALATPPPARALRKERTSIGRLRWLELTVAPALHKAHDEGIIDLSEWLTRHGLIGQ
ncbi:MAG TPA: hypothetical protein VFQ05_19045 [Candidatus Eisenbacteria bacterium]|nr:hypothetical protein [Candidatus Eisenbacteria bacterium]